MSSPSPRKVNRFAAMSSQTSHARWRLHIAAVDDRESRDMVVTLRPGATLIGRDPEGTGEVIAFADRLMSRTHATFVVRGPGKRVELIDHDSRNGCWHDGRRVEGTAWLADGAVVRLGGLVAVLESDGGLVPDGDGPNRWVPGNSALARQIRDRLDMASGDDMPMLLVGAPSTGKMRAARSVHDIAGRGGELVVVDVPSVPADDFPLLLFGRGLRQGVQGFVPGAFRRAHNGTLVLDNVTALPAQMQVKLQRAVEERLISPSDDEDALLPIDVRVIATATDDLRQRVNDNRFLRSLATFLRSHEIHMPTLRQRIPDLVALANNLVHPPPPARSWSDALDADTIEVLLLQEWGGNLAQLRGVMRQAGELLDKGHSGIDVLPPGFITHVQRMVAQTEAQEQTRDEPPISKVSRAESRPDAIVLRELMTRHRGNLGAVARELGAHRRQVYRWLDYAGVPRDFGT